MNEDNPGVRVPPPVIFFGSFLAGLALRPLVPFHLPGGMKVALPLLAIALPIGFWGLVLMLRARTGIIPHHPASALITTGPFRISRNPLYVTIILSYLGAAWWIDVAAAVALLPFAIVALQRWVIRREEAYLERRFGDDYRRYRERVRRWL
jgi:protein-S-isoprenylcysteine O-methyltransferase Ste14